MKNRIWRFTATLITLGIFSATLGGVYRADGYAQRPDTATSLTFARSLGVDLKLLLTFDDPLGVTLFQDQSKYDDHAVCHPGACPAWAARGLDFNGQNQYLMSTASIEGAEVFALAGWFYARSYELAGKYPLVFHAPGADCGRASLQIGGGNTAGPTLFVADADDCVTHEVVSAPTAPSLNEWHFIVAVFDSKTDHHLIYVDGVKVAENVYPIGPVPKTHPGHPMTIGVNYSPRPEDQRWWDGSMDDIIVVQRRLSEAEVKQLFASGR